ncbi:MAG: STAS domain-containing protein [Caldilineaceae bacterium]
MEIQTRTVNDIHIVELQGRLDAHQAKQVDKTLAEVIHPTSHTVVNLSKAHFIDSTGLSVLIKGVKHHREQQGDLVLCALQQPVRIIFELTRLEKIFTIYPTEEEAIQAFQ